MRELTLDANAPWQPAPTFDASPGHGAGGNVRFSAIFRRYRVPFTLIMALAVLGAILVTLCSSRSYKAKTLLEVMDYNQDFMNGRDLNPNTEASTGDFIETETKLLQSDSIADRVVNALSPKLTPEDYTTQGGLKRFVRSEPAQPASPEDVIRQMLGQMKVKQQGQTSLIAVTLEGPTPKIAADTVNTLAQEFIADAEQSRWNTASHTGEFLNGQIATLRQKLEESEQQLQDYARRSGLVYTGDATHESVDTEKLRQIQQDLEAARAIRADKQAQYNMIQGSSVNALPQIVDDASIRDYNTKLADLRRQEADLRATLTPQHYKVKQVEDQIQELQSEISRHRDVLLGKIKADYLAAVNREQLRAKDFEAQIGRVSGQNAKEVRYNMLKREVDANRDLYQSMLQKVKEASVASALRASNIRVVDPAKPSFLPSSPSLPINLALGILLGIVSFVLFVLMRERMNQSIRMPGESVKLLDVPELATIPSAKRDLRITGSSLASDGEGGKGGLLGSTRELSLEKVADKWATHGSIVAESFRSAVTSILLWGRYHESNPVLVISSAHAKAGKTTSTFNLGLGLAESGRRVLIIDGDLRLSRLGQIFGVGQADGLTDILSGRVDSTLAADLVQSTPVAGLHILPSGSPHPNVPQLLHSPLLDDAIRDLRKDFDFVLIDSPPMIPLTDARLLGKHADGVILICRAGHTSVDQLVASRRRLSEDGTLVIGTILNDWNANSEDPSYVKSYEGYQKPVRSSR